MTEDTTGEDAEEVEVVTIIIVEAEVTIVIAMIGELLKQKPLLAPFYL